MLNSQNIVLKFLKSLIHLYPKTYLSKNNKRIKRSDIIDLNHKIFGEKGVFVLCAF